MMDREVYTLLTRWYHLRQLGNNLVPPLWSDFYVEKTRFTECERWKLWTLTGGIHGERVYLTIDQLREIVEQGEANARKPMQREDNVLTVRDRTHAG